MTTFRTTLRRLATEQDAGERLRLSDVLASELEVAFNRQSNQAQLAVSDTEEVLLKNIDRLQEQVGDNNTLISAFLTNFPAQLATFQTELRGAVAEETARGLGKLSADIDVLKRGQAAYNERLEELDERHGKQWEEVQATVEQIAQRLSHDEARLDQKRMEIDQIHREIAEIKEYIKTSRRGELDALKARVAELEARLEGRGDGD